MARVAVLGLSWYKAQDGSQSHERDVCFYLWKLKKHAFDEQESVGLKKKISKTYNFWKVLINIDKLILHCFILNQVGMDEAEAWMMSYT